MLSRGKSFIRHVQDTPQTKNTTIQENKSPTKQKSLKRRNTISTLKQSLSNINLNVPLMKKKITVVGDGDTGKSALISTFAFGKFPDSYIPTVFENYLTTMEVDGARIALSLLDTAGQEDYDRLRAVMYPDTDCLIVCFSVDSIMTFENVESRWAPEIKHYLPYTPIILVGCKMDLRNHCIKRLQCVDQHDGILLAQRIGAKAYVECSAKNGNGIHDLIERAVKESLVEITRVKKREKRCNLL